jgi:hypothetical protein
MPLPYAFILLRTANLRLGPADRTVLQFLLLQGGKAPQIVVGRIGRDRIGRRLGFASGGVQELERFPEALPDHVRIVSSAHGKACMPGCRDRQSVERLCVAA